MVLLTIGDVKAFAPSHSEYVRYWAIVVAKTSHAEKLAAMQQVGEEEIYDLIRKRVREIERRREIEAKKT